MRNNLSWKAHQVVDRKETAHLGEKGHRMDMHYVRSATKGRVCSTHSIPGRRMNFLALLDLVQRKRVRRCSRQIVKKRTRMDRSKTKSVRWKKEFWKLTSFANLMI